MMGTTVAPVTKTIELACAPERAFEAFTAEIDSWWPLDTYSINGEKAARAVFEARIGGRIYEISNDGVEAQWGTVLACEPPFRLVWTWHPAGDPSNPTEVEVRFVATDAGTRLELEHRNWDRLGEKASASRNGYDNGWNEVLAAFAGAV